MFLPIGIAVLTATRPYTVKSATILKDTLINIEIRVFHVIMLHYLTKFLKILSTVEKIFHVFFSQLQLVRPVFKNVPYLSFVCCLFRSYYYFLDVFINFILPNQADEGNKFKE